MIIESVPNFSEGRDFEKIDRIVHAGRVPGVVALHVDTGAAANRTVVTYVGARQALIDGLYEFIKESIAQIDISTHTGVHPFFGAVDVLPFVPLQNATMEDCIECSRELGARVGKDLKLPVFLYARSATNPKRTKLANLRKGGFRRLANRMQTNPYMQPDFGPASPHPTAGAIAIGAREILVAFNISLNTNSSQIAQHIAELLRASGPNLNNPLANQARRISNCQAIGWYVEEYGCAQVSTNITNYHQTSIATVFQAAEEFAQAFGVKVTGAEVVGLIPRDALQVTGSRYTSSTDSQTLIKAAIDNLNLSLHYPFVPEEKIIEARLEQVGIITG